MKQKTKKAAKKRFHVSPSGKVRRRRTHQAHFNARATGNETRHKHKDEQIADSDKGRVARLLPYS
ncbi:50S ribosomal protein L35 [bacterium]|nr:50S ribosomal protein L35 [bacterium]